MRPQFRQDEIAFNDRDWCPTEPPPIMEQGGLGVKGVKKQMLRGEGG